MSVAYIGDHVDQGLGRLAQQYKNQPNVTSLVTAMISRVQVVEDALRKVATQRALYGNTAQGAQLDDLGALVGVARQGLSDEVYRVLIRGEIAKNNSNGTLEALLNVARIVFQAEGVWITSPDTFGAAREGVTAEVSLAIASPKTDTSLFPRLISILKATLSGGIKLVSVTVFAQDGALSMDGDQPWARGFADVAVAGGVPLANLIYQDANA